MAKCSEELCDHHCEVTEERKIRAITGWRRLVGRKYLNLTPTCRPYGWMTPVDNRWMILATETVLSHFTFTVYEIMSTLKPRVFSSVVGPVLS